MNIWEHEQKALEIWLKHYDQCVEELGVESNWQEREWAIEAFRESRQLKLLHQDGSIKVKWEMPCWWADCKHTVFHGDYYCVLAHPKDVTWKSPHELAIELGDVSFLKEMSE
jgi:hypothetical protein